MSMRPGAQPCGPDDGRAGDAGGVPQGMPGDPLGELFDDIQFAGLCAVLAARRSRRRSWRWGRCWEFAQGRRTAKRRRGRSLIDWKCALGLEPADSGVDASVLSEFRARLAADDQAERLLQRMLARLRERGLLVRAGGSVPRPARGWPRCGARTGWSW